MKKLLIMCVVVVSLAGCEANTSSNIDIAGEDILYMKDIRTGLCFALTASRKSFDVNSTGIAMANVPCSDEVLLLIKN